MSNLPPGDRIATRPPLSRLTCSSRFSTRLVVSVLGVTILLDSLVQVLWKSVAMALPTSGGAMSLARAALQPAVWLLIALFGLQLVLWTRLLKQVDLSFAQPITSLSFLGVALLSVLVLGESFSLPKGVGIALILLGVWLISSTPMRTADLQTTAAAEVIDASRLTIATQAQSRLPPSESIR